MGKARVLAGCLVLGYVYVCYRSRRAQDKGISAQDKDVSAQDGTFLKVIYDDPKQDSFDRIE